MSIVVVLVVAIVVGVLLIAALLTTLVTLAFSSSQTYPYEFPEAECGEPCLTVEDARLLIPDDATFAFAGAVSRGALADDAPVRDWEGRASEEFYFADGEPLACLFALSPAPVAPQSSSTGYYDETVVDLLSATGGVTVTQMARVSTRGLDSGRYPAMVAAAVARCPGFTMEMEDGTTRTVVVDEVELDIDVDGVESVAWTETEAGAVTVVADIQFATIAVRTEVRIPEGSTVSVEQVTELVRATAERLAAL